MVKLKSQQRLSTEEQILAVAKEVFTRKGYAATRMQEIADQAEINKAMLHYYFRSKEKLFNAILEKTIAEIAPRFTAALRQKGTTLQRIENIVRTYIQTIRANPHMPIFILHELSQNRTDFIATIKSKLTEYPDFTDFFQQMQTEMQAGEIREYNPLHLLLNVMSMCIFPFIARPIFSNIVDIPVAIYDQLLLQRENEIMQFVRQALQP